MPIRVLQYGDLENAFDDPNRIARVAGRIADERDERTVVVGTGDSLAPSVTGLTTGGEQTLPFYDAVRPVAETVGNHDFDLGVDALERVVEASPQDWVSANIRVERGGLANVDPATRVERDGESVRFVGATDPGTSVPVSATDPVAAVESVVSARSPADSVVVLAHAGRTVATDLAGLDAVDAVLAGHLHDAETTWVGETPVVRAGATGRVVQSVELGESVSVTPLDTDDAPRASAVEERLRAVRAESGLTETVTRVDTPVERSREAGFRGRSRALALVADAYRWAADADVGFVDVRALRDGPPLDGAVTAADLVGLVPFDAALRSCRVTGAELRALLDGALVTEGDVLARTAVDAAWTGYVSGVTVAWSPEGCVLDVAVGGEPIRDAETYTLATNPYVVGTDAEFDVLDSRHVERTGETQYEAVVAYAREHGVPDLDGRFERVDAASADSSGRRTENG